MNDARLDSDTIDFAIIFPPKVNLTKATDYCSNCGAACAPTASIEVDPLCTGCKFAMRAEDTFLPLDTPHDLHFVMKPIG